MTRFLKAYVTDDAVLLVIMVESQNDWFLTLSVTYLIRVSPAIMIIVW